MSQSDKENKVGNTKTDIAQDILIGISNLHPLRIFTKPYITRTAVRKVLTFLQCQSPRGYLQKQPSSQRVSKSCPLMNLNESKRWVKANQ